MTCPRCHAKNEAGARFCEDCGARLDLACPSCSAPVTTGKKFCRSCGALAADATLRASPQSYTPPHLAEKILTSRSALEGERKQVTVLFADLKGSMELLADRDPEEARKLLDPVLHLMMDAVHRYEGTVNQVMGDGIMALFGAPLAHEDHAVRACYAALRMQEAVNRHADEMFRTHGMPVQIRVGLNSGEVVVRAIGSDLHMDYTAVGQTTHLAARMEQLATPGTILIAPATLELAEGFVEVRPRGPVPIKGLEAPIEVFEVTGAGVVRSRLQAAAARGLTLFVGRSDELEALRHALERAGGGHGQVVAVVGEPGIGKSRLFWEFTHSHRTHGWLLLEAASVSYGKASPYAPVMDLLRAYFRVADRDAHREIREKVTGKLLTLDRTLEPVLAPLLALLDVPVEDTTWQALDTPQRRQRTLDAVRRLLLRESQVQPLMLIFEDLHWIDSETQALLDSLVESLPTTAVLLLVNYRPEYRHDWGGKTYYAQLRIDPLPPESAEELLVVLLGTDTGLQPLKRALIERTQSNPFFLEEGVRALVEVGVLSGERGNHRLAKPLEALHVPATVHAVLAARIDRLSPDDKQLLQTAAVVGKDVPFTLLQAIADTDEGTLRQRLARLQAAEFLYETRLFPDAEYTFKHALTHEVAYGSLLAERRRLLHRQIVDAIEQLHRDRIAEHVDRLADHAFRAETWDRALGYLREAGDRAKRRSAFAEAVVSFERALEALAHLPVTPEWMAQAVDVRLSLRNPLATLTRYGQILDYMRQAEPIARRLGDRRRLGWVLAQAAHALRAVGNQEQVVDSAGQALAIALALEDPDLEAVAIQFLAQGHIGLGKSVQAVELLRRAIELVDARPPSESVDAVQQNSYARAWLGQALAHLGRFPEALATGEEAVRVAEATDRPWYSILPLGNLGMTYLAKGDLEKAVPLFERAIDLARSWGIGSLFSPAPAGLASAYALLGRFPEAVTMLEEARPNIASSLGPARILFALGQAYLLAGRLDEALETTHETLGLARRRREPEIEARCLALLGGIAGRRVPAAVEQAEAHYQEALELAEPRELRPLVAHCHRGLGTVLAQSGQRERAAVHLARAVALYREMDMRFWLPATERELATLYHGGV